MLMDPKMFILIHVFLSILGLVAGLVLVGGLMAGKRFNRWTDLFFLTSLFTSLTGYGFPSAEVMPAHIIGAISLIALAGAMLALYWKKLHGAWRPTFVVLSVVALYLNVFVLLAQLFQKVPGIALLASTSSTPVFTITQGLVLALFIVLGWMSKRAFTNPQGD